MKQLRKLVTKIDPRHWILLSQDFSGNWSFLVGDAQPLDGLLGRLNEEEAKAQALSAAEEHWRRDGFWIDRRAVPSASWHVAVRCIVA
jgi:hypothetical protein